MVRTLREIFTELDNTQRQELAHLIANASSNHYEKNSNYKITFKKFYDDITTKKAQIEVSNMVITALQNIHDSFINNLES